MSNKLVLVLNCGSSSLKFAVIDAQTGDDQISGLAECFGLEDSRIKWKINGEKQEAALGAFTAHREAVEFIVNKILAGQPELAAQIQAVGHRIVHGGEKFTRSVIIDDSVIKGIEDCASLAPLHNPAHLIGIRAAMASFPKLPQVAVFDTAFHQSMPDRAYVYALPYKLYREHGIRRYGMHGTSHLFVSREAAKMLNKPLAETNVICAHLGNGASVTAVKGGKSVDTSMGLTPLEGLVMGTRCGDIDPSIIYHLVHQLGYTLEEVNNLMNKQSGLLGISELTNDCRGIEEGYADGHKGATLALEIFCYRLAKYIASYTVPLGRLDAVVFTGGIGENSDLIREKVLNLLEIFNFHVDSERNKAARFGKKGIITQDNSTVAMVIPTNEEWVIAEDSIKLINKE
ncbi:MULTISPECIES: acetate kinase [Shewanella]|uniref:Acetate kinase n=4 Tax=Shewanella TaxID=22 RepID=ACKA_SHESW|nr:MULTISPECIES: acetate kinase [Shewanella]A1RIH0.1 RecName: Full=Acetate kinase; AltName: Full=Acetokinase [Shewanella sp. W3-18-1]A4Y819.1 RecName: Full=Acetate kinase; AltName: Full=Acetokinase [Shewanella putrefaciens CN-32]CAD6364086.1 Acetate kinase [Shewanella hafniensis]ABM24465.1 acetate kinase [Shewanella sp. W3-18-1]AVV86215.1 acetate kinase acetate kinase [Shewanella putrefaciens]MCA1897750.1 acetate kinase [Shewanella putrefaciens]MCK7629668.1 acetate kinase [Shewanella sp. JNE